MRTGLVNHSAINRHTRSGDFVPVKFFDFPHPSRKAALAGFECL